MAGHAKRYAKKAGRSGKGGGYGKYKYTTKRAVALRRAQAISARKRKGKRMKYAAGAAIGVIGVGTVAVLGHKYGGTAVDSVKSYAPGMTHLKNQAIARMSVAPGIKELIRTRTAISPASTPRPNAPRARSSKAATAAQGAKEFTHTDLGKVDPQSMQGADPHSGAFPKRAEDIAAVKKMEAASDRPYNVDKFLPRPIVRGRKKLPAKVAQSAVEKHARNKGEVTGKQVDRNPILNQMIADGTVSKRTRGRRTASNKGTPGGRRTPAKAQPKNQMTEAQIQAALGFDVVPETPIEPVASVTKITHAKSIRGPAVAAAKKAAKTTQGRKTPSKVPPIKASSLDPTGNTMGWNDLMSYQKKNAIGSLKGKKVSLWNKFNAFDRAAKEEKLFQLGYYIDPETGEIYGKDDPQF